MKPLNRLACIVVGAVCALAVDYFITSDILPTYRVVLDVFVGVVGVVAGYWVQTGYYTGD